jgi:hypothetical protein
MTHSRREKTLLLAAHHFTYCNATMAKISACALGALLFGASTMLSADAFAGMDHRKSATALKMVSG